MLVKGQCYVCHDKKRAEAKLSELILVNNQLSRYVSKPVQYNTAISTEKERRNELIQLKNRFLNSNNHPHFMCGKCQAFNESLYSNTEEQVRLKCYNICIYIDRYSKTDVNNILRILQGRYPQFYTLVLKSFNDHNQEALK